MDQNNNTNTDDNSDSDGLKVYDEDEDSDDSDVMSYDEVTFMWQELIKPFLTFTLGFWFSEDVSFEKTDRLNFTNITVIYGIFVDVLCERQSFNVTRKSQRASSNSFQRDINTAVTEEDLKRVATFFSEKRYDSEYVIDVMLLWMLLEIGFQIRSKFYDGAGSIMFITNSLDRRFILALNLIYK